MLTPKNEKIITIVFIIIILLLIAIAAIYGYITHSLHNAVSIFPYIGFFTWSVMGIISLTKGRQRLREVRVQGEQTSWYKQPQIDNGIAFLLLGVFFLLESLVNHLPDTMGTIVLCVMIVVLFIPMFTFYFFTFKYRASIQNANKK